MIGSVTCSSLRVSASMQSKKDEDIRRLSTIGNRIKSIARAERRYAERQCKWALQKHSEGAKAFKQLCDDAKANLDDHEDLECETDELDSFDLLADLKNGDESA